MADNKIIVPVRSNARYGWRPDLPDQRDLMLAISPGDLAAKLPKKYDERAKDIGRYNQGELGSCTANAICGMYRYQRIAAGKGDADVSRLFLYYNERAMEGTIDSDAGAYIRDGLKSASNLGIASENLWPYDISKFAQQPPQTAYVDALNHQALQYRRLPQTLIGLKAILAQGYQFVYGFTVYESFESEAVARNGMVPLPASTEGVLGGHAVRAVGYDDTINGGCFIVANSWGESWGDKGYFYMPYAYVTSHNLASDFWCIRSSE